MKAPSLVSALLLTLSSLTPGAAFADQIWLANGRQLEGIATELPDGRIAVKTSFGTLVLAADKIDRIEREVSLEEEVMAARARLAEGDVGGLYELASWCEQQGASTLSRRLLAEVLELDPNHAGARDGLGFRRYQDRWVNEREYHALRGEVLFRGAWLPAAERGRILAWETAQATAETERRRAASQAAELAAREARVAAQEQAQQQARAQESPGPLYNYNPFCCVSPYVPYYVPAPRPPRRPSHPDQPGPTPEQPQPSPVIPRSHHGGVARPPG